MSYIGNQPSQIAFVSDSFSGNGSTTVFTMSVAPANTASVLVAVSGVLQDPSTYSVSGTTLTFSAAPPTGTSNISARYLGIPASGITTTAYRTVTEFTATSGQTTFTPPSYTAGFINVYQSGVLLGSADYTATNGTTVVLTTGAPLGALVTIESFNVSSVLNAIPNQARSVTRTNMPVGSLLQVVQGTYSSQTSMTGTTPVATGITASITPTFSTSKILVTVFIPAYNASSGANAFYSLYKNGSNLNQLAYYQTSDAGSNPLITPYTAIYLDSPATTSSITYSIYAATAGGATQYWAFGGLQCSITLQEIAA